MRAPQYGKVGKRVSPSKVKPVNPSPLVIPVDTGAANCDTIRQRHHAGFMRLNTGFQRVTGKGLKARTSPIEAVAIEPYSGARRSRGPAIQGQAAHGIYARDPVVKVKMHLWHKSARRDGALVPSLQGPIISKR